MWKYTLYKTYQQLKYVQIPKIEYDPLLVFVSIR